MLTNEQCIEVAEMWGWQRKLFNGVPMWMGDPTNGSWVAEEYLPEMVNSWQGFGRTVEAIKQKQETGKINMGNYNCFIDELVLAMFQYPFNVEIVCSIVHLSALEAMKND